MSRLRLSIIIWFILATYVIIVVSWWIGRQAEKFPISVVELNGNIKHVVPQEVSGVVQDFVAPGFFGIKIDALKGRLSELPWVASVAIKKTWPNKLAIYITEKQALAKLSDGGFVTAAGEIFDPSQSALAVSFSSEGAAGSSLDHAATAVTAVAEAAKPVMAEQMTEQVVGVTAVDNATMTARGIVIEQELPIFRGNRAKIADMLENYLFLSEQFLALGLEIKELEIMPDSGWRAVLSRVAMAPTEQLATGVSRGSAAFTMDASANLACAQHEDQGSGSRCPAAGAAEQPAVAEVVLFLGKEALPERAKRFVLAYKGLLQAKIEKIAYIDARYTNGVAVGWKH